MSHREIVINHPGDGDWVMARAGGVFNNRMDHVVAMHRDGQCVGGLVYTGYLGASIMMHSAGSEDNWVTRDFLWMIFDYAFTQLGCRKVIGLVSSSNTRALAINARLGFVHVVDIPEMFTDGSSLVILSMTKDQCRWLRIRPRYYRNNIVEYV